MPSNPSDVVQSAYAKTITAVDIFSISPDDNNDLAAPVRMIECTGDGGDLRVLTFNGNDRTVKIDAGGVKIVGVTKVFSTGTTATGLEGYV